MDIQDLNEDMIMVLSDNGWSSEDYDKLKLLIKGNFPRKKLRFVTFDEDTI